MHHNTFTPQKCFEMSTNLESERRVNGMVCMERATNRMQGVLDETEMNIILRGVQRGRLLYNEFSQISILST